MTKSEQTIRSDLAKRLAAMDATGQKIKSQGLMHCVAEDERLDGRTITVRGKQLVHFGSCSYLGLETDSRLKTAACEAILRYGVQFSSSRSYVSAPLYAEYEALLARVVGGHPLVVAPTTSLAHQSALPVLIHERDAVLYDGAVHQSVQAVLPTLRLQGASCEMLPHNRLDVLEDRARALAKTHDRVFFLCDGVYGMHGDIIDIAALRRVLDYVPQLHAYVDDAHGVGWTGRNGAGAALHDLQLHERMVVVLGLSKGFGAAGGAIVCNSPDVARQIFTLGRTLMFSGPLQPAQLGAAIASANILLSEEIQVLQQELLERITLFDGLAQKEGLPVHAPSVSPIRFIQVGREEHAMELGAQLQSAGFFTNL
ncbi:MAG TPA: aminotransferase class I/II-fold pyridoxal phosphate-dependent enzyme, partial [Polyangiales bacterium]|nr:aminotransferase class I/II-fold pyridoxal phosphate-dependent enzyme [Polyangiales bacterium]